MNNPIFVKPVAVCEGGTCFYADEHSDCLFCHVFPEHEGFPGYEANISSSGIDASVDLGKLSAAEIDSIVSEVF